jgi:asparagine synthase (glutamine-hydrolysing)
MDAGHARAAVRAAFRDPTPAPQLLSDGPLTLAWAETPSRSVYTCEETVCLLEGALYELDDLRRAAGSDGPPARLLADAYRALGAGVLGLLRGDFWALLWDRSACRGILVADQLGGRSPYWTRRGGDVVFASEVPELLAALPRRPDPDPVSLAHWLMLTIAPGGATLFAGLHRLEAAHYLALGDGRSEPRRYWSPVYRPALRAPRDELVERIRETLSVSVRRRLADPSTIGVRLSGGLDSSVVAALATRASSAPLHAYSATFPLHPTVDESELIDCTVERLGLRSTRIVVREGSVLAGALSFIAAWQLPPTSPNLFFWLPLFARAGADGRRVMLDGEGGDELFGLSPYLLADRLRHGRVLSAIGLTQRIPTTGRSRSAARVWRLLRDFGLRGAVPPAAHTLRRRLRGPERYAPPWLAPGVASAWLSSEDSAFAWKRAGGPRWWSYVVEAVTRSGGSALAYEQSRRIAALAGLESRHPLVDVDVIELVLQLAPELAFDARLNRPLLRDSVTGWLPDEVRLRPTKSNFDALFHASLAGPDLAVARRILSARDAELAAYVDLGVLQRGLVARDPPGEGDPVGRQRWAIRVWRLLAAECWLRSQADPSYPERLREREGLAAEAHELVARG